MGQTKSDLQKKYCPNTEPQGQQRHLKVTMEIKISTFTKIYTKVSLRFNRKSSLLNSTKFLNFCATKNTLDRRRRRKEEEESFTYKPLIE